MFYNQTRVTQYYKIKTGSDSMIKIELLNSLAKVYPDRDIDIKDRLQSGCMLKNEVYSFQAAYRADAPFQGTVNIFTEAPDEIKDIISIRYVDYVPCDMPMYDRTLKSCDHPEPGLFPDILRELPAVRWVYSNAWRSVFISIDASKKPVAPGKYDITVHISNDADHSETFTLDVLDAELPEQRLTVTHWFHTDSLCNYYGFEFDSDEYWRVTENFAKTAAEYGINMLLTPIFTPPLDTAPGGERRTIQLVDVIRYEDGGESTDGAAGDVKYSFGFEKLSKWIAMCKRAGIRYFEISHLFTQWGCKYAPKVMAECRTSSGTEYRRIFGWETPGCSDEYLTFLSQLLPELTDVLRAEGVFDQCYFHVSDEPSAEVMEDYRKCAGFMRRYVPSDRIFDALSDITFYRNGLVTCPVVALDHIHAFIEERPPHLWAYYCCGQVTTANKFLAYPAWRNRMLGAQLFKYGTEGFLQWGYNFYNTHLSLESVDPYATSTAGGWVPGGDPFVVYPSKDGSALPSLRLEIFREAMQDMRAMEALASKMAGTFPNPRDAVSIALGLEELRFDKFDFIDNSYLINLRERINKMLAGVK